MANWIEKLRRWIDSENNLYAVEEVLQSSEKAGQNKTKSELFLQKLLQEIETVLNDEIIRNPRRKNAYVPERFIVFISSDKEKSLPKEKRDFFEQFLSAQISESASEIAGQLGVSVGTIAVEVRVSRDLEGDEVKVQTSGDKFDETFEISLRQSFEWKTMSAEQAPFNDLATIKENDNNLKAFYHLEVWRDGMMEKESPVTKREIFIGRDYPGSSAHIRLQSENRKISGLHASINYDETGEILLTSLHKNPTVAAGKILTNGDTASLTGNDPIAIYEFTLRLKFADN